MNEEMIKQVIKAFSFSVPIDIICENTGMTKEQASQFLEDHKEAIAEEMAFNKMKAGE